jgi:hypothetical protein
MILVMILEKCCLCLACVLRTKNGKKIIPEGTGYITTRVDFVSVYSGKQSGPVYLNEFQGIVFAKAKLLQQKMSRFKNLSFLKMGKSFATLPIFEKSLSSS